MKIHTWPVKKQIGAAFLALFCFSCTPDPNLSEPEPEPEKPVPASPYEKVNGWTYNTMQDHYYWYEHLPAKSSTDTKLTPSAYLNSLSYQQDRFSHIVRTDLQASANTRAGAALPAILDTVFRFGEERVGYLFYLDFLPVNGDITALKNAFARMKTEGVRELVLDLRFNTGGYYDIMLALCSMIIPERGKPFAYREYRRNGAWVYEEDRLDASLDEYCLDLQQLHVIVHNYTASASELAIHTLRQFIPVYLYGGKTYGKNVGSQLFSNTLDNVPYELNLITTRLCDARREHDPGFLNTGLSVDHPLDSRYGSYYHFYGQLGEYDAEKVYEPMLNYVLGYLGYTSSAISVRSADRERVSTAVSLSVPHLIVE